MATSGDLAKGLAEALGLATPMVQNTYRRLREADLVPKAGRGPTSSLKMDSKVTARLLTTLGGRISETEPVGDVIERFTGVKSVMSELIVDDAGKKRVAEIYGRFFFDDIEVPALTSLGEGHTIEAAVQGLLESHLSIGLREDGFTPRTQFDEIHKGVFWPDIEVRFYGPVPRATISVSVWPSDDKLMILNVEYWTDSMVALFEDVTKNRAQIDEADIDHFRRYLTKTKGDFEISRRFGAKTISKAASILSERNFDELGEEDE